jgi:hypothetical protein
MKSFQKLHSSKTTSCKSFQNYILQILPKLHLANPFQNYILQILFKTAYCNTSCQNITYQTTFCPTTSCQNTSCQTTSCQTTSCQATSCQNTSCQNTSCQKASSVASVFKPIRTFLHEHFYSHVKCTSFYAFV